MGLYPAVQTRHIIWIVPLSLFVVAAWVDKLLTQWEGRWVPAASLIGMALAAVVIARVPMEHTSDGGLFSALAKLPTQSNVVLF